MEAVTCSIVQLVNDVMRIKKSGLIFIHHELTATLMMFLFRVIGDTPYTP